MKSHQKVQTAQVARSCCGPAFQPSSLRDPSPPHEGPFPRNAAVAQKTAVHHGAGGAAARPGSFCACVAEEDDERLDL